MAPRLLLGTTLAGALLAGCSPGPATPTGLRVVSTVTQVSALARAVGGDRIALTALLTPRDDPHEYEMKPEQVSRLQGARLVLLSGAGVDRWMEQGLAAAGVAGRALDLSRAVRLRPGAGGGVDPHWWYDPGNAAAAADSIASALAGADPANGEVYRQNAESLRSRLQGADAAIHGLIDPVPVERRLLVANHDAFNYFLARYGITLVGDVVPSTDSIQAVRPADIARLVQAIRDRHVCAVFTETTLDPKLAAQIAGEAHVIVFDGRLYGDAIGEPGTRGETLEGALVENARLMAAAFRSC